MTVEQLVEQIQNGDTGQIPALWERVRRFIIQQAGRYLAALRGYNAGLELDDLTQAGFLALMEAADSFDPGKGMSFLNWMNFHLKTEWQSLTDIRSSRRDALAWADSLDRPLDDDGEATLADTIADPTNNVEDAELSIWRSELHAAMSTALASLPEEQRAILEGRFYRELSQKETAAACGTTVARVRSGEHDAIRQLRHSEELEAFIERETPYYRHVGVRSFNTTGTSATESAVLRRERLRELLQRKR